MAAFLCWYLIITLLGWLAFPMVYHLFPALADRGYSLARAAGLLVWGYVFWLGTSLGLTENNVGGILFGLLAVIGLSTASILLPQFGMGSRKSEITSWLRQNVRLVIAIEILFLLSFGFLAIIRAGNPELDNAEKPMELMLINAILRSPAFPPHDSWLSGFAISYYYFGYVMTAMLAMLSGVTGSVAHNLMTALVFALAAVGAYGILYNLLTFRESQTVDTESSIVSAPNTASCGSFIGSALLAPLFLLLVSNLEGFLEVLHRAGLFWSGPQNFWTWLGIKELSDAPMQPLGWIPDRFWWWWRASRVISDYDLVGNFREVIDEFPFFSFLHADLHPHVLAIPFNLLAVAIALNIFLGGWRGETNLLGLRLKLSPLGFFAAALTLGGLAFLNTWDVLVAAALILSAYVLWRAQSEGWSWARLEDLFLLGLPLAALAVLLYLPFYFGFSSQAGGVLPNLTNPTRGAQLWVMFAPLFVPLLAYLIYLSRGEKRSGRWVPAFLVASGLVLVLWGVSWVLAWLASARDPTFARDYLGSQGALGPGSFFTAAMSRRFSYLGGLLTLLAILVPSLAFLTDRRQSAASKPPDPGNNDSEMASRAPTIKERHPSFVLLLMVIGCLLVLAPEFLFLRDQFNSRLNTIFKFYYQAWLLWSIAAAFGLAVILQGARGPWARLFRIVIVVVMFMSLTYPVLALSNKTNGFNPALGWTLDDFERIQRGNPDEAAAISWLRSAPDGVVAEAVGGSYTGYARISEYTGLPTVLGWPGHESQWRGGGEPQGTRQDDIALLYSTRSWDAALAVLQKYDVRYVYVGGLERSTYTVQEDKFQRNLTPVFQQGSIIIYQSP
jgi:YYY domain-containing protein